MNKPVVSGIIVCWLLILQEFDITIHYKPSQENVVADFLLRITSEKEHDPLDVSFQDEHLFAISMMASWFIDITNYFLAHNLAEYFS